MANEVLAVCRFTHVSGIDRDRASTTWAFTPANQDPATLNGIADSIISWWNTPNPGRGIHEYIAVYYSRASNACDISFYDISGSLSGTPFGSPIHTRTFTLEDGTPAVFQLPEEVAVRQTVLAGGWQTVPETAPNPNAGQPGEPNTIRPRSRYRGGFYMPGINGMCIQDANTGPRVHASLKTDLGSAWFRFLDERPDFGIWSRRDAVVRPVVAPPGEEGRVDIDNELDTIRKRGPRETSVTQVWP